MYKDDIKLFAKNEKELETLHAVRIYSQDRRMEFGIEKCGIEKRMEFGIEKCGIEKSGKRHLTDGMELPNQVKTRTLREKETYKYLGIFEADTIKQMEMKEKLRKNISGEPESYSRQNYVAETSSKEKISGLYPSLDIRDHF